MLGANKECINIYIAEGIIKYIQTFLLNFGFKKNNINGISEIL